MEQLNAWGVIWRNISNDKIVFQECASENEARKFRFMHCPLESPTVVVRTSEGKFLLDGVEWDPSGEIK